MKYVVLIHSNPQPWGHPTGDYLAEHQALPQEQRERMNAEFDQLLTEMQQNGELVSGEALGDPATSRLATRHGVVDETNRCGVGARVRKPTGGSPEHHWPPTVPTPRPRSIWPASS